MRKLFKGIGSAGLSLVELIISMAILAVVGIAIGGAMYASSRSYTRATAEVNVQEEAQVASNLICDWIVDAVAVNPTAAPGGGYEPGEFDEGEFTELYIIHPEGDKLMRIHVFADATNELLKYEAVEVNDDWDVVAGGDTYSGELAKNVTGCYFYNTFKTDRNVRISVDFNVSERTYRSVTDSTSRSHDFISTGGAAVNARPVIRFERVSRLGGAHVTLEPGQTGTAAYTFYIYIDNCGFDPSDSNYTLTANTTGLTHTSISTPVWNSSEARYECAVSSDSSASGAESVSFTATAPGGSDTKSLAFKIRRVTDCKFKGYKDGLGTYQSVSVGDGNLKLWEAKTGETGKSGSVYESEISLGITNQADESVQGADFDKSPYNYKDPASIKVYTMSYTTNYAGTWYNPGVATTSVTYTDGVPSVKVTLNQDLEYDLYVVVVAEHSGTLSGNLHNSDWKAGCGVSLGAANNKPAAFGLNVSYGSGGGVAGNHAYFDVIKIKKGSGGYNPFTDVGGGVRRGTPACMIALYDSTFQTNLRKAIKDAYPGTSDESINSGGFTYKTILHFKTEFIYDRDPVTHELVLRIGADGKPVKNTTGAYQDFFVYSNDNLEATFKEASRRLRDSSTTIFDLDKSYDIYLEYQVWKGSECKDELKFKTTGNVPAATPYVYNPGNGKFRLTDSKDTQITVPKQNNYQMGLYIEGCNFNNGHYLTAKVERLVNGSWTPVNNVITQTTWTEQPGAITGTIVFDNPTDTRTYPVGQYLENTYGFKNQNLEILHLNTSGLVSGGNYRLVFDTDYPCATSINYSAGTVTTGTAHYLLDDCVYFTVS